MAPGPTARTGTAREAARRHRAELRQAVRSFAEAVDAPVAAPAWLETLQVRLQPLRQRLAEHVEVTEGPGGLYAELLEHAPRLSRPVAALVADHGDLQVAVETLAGRLREHPVQIEQVRRAAAALVEHLRRHRQQGADLLYEAYATDIGGET